MSSVARTALRSIRATPTARFSTSTPVQKSATDAVKDTAETVNRKVGDTLASGIEAGQQVGNKAKAAAGMSAGQAEGKANEMAGKAKGAVEEAKGKAKGAAEEAKGKMS